MFTPQSIIPSITQDLTPSVDTTVISNELSSLPGVGDITPNPALSVSNASIPSVASLSAEVNAALTQTTTRSLANAPTDQTMTNDSQNTQSFQLTLTSKQNPGDEVVFNVSPTIDESRAANYDHMSPVHHPGSIQVYKSTEARSFNVSAKFISRTAAEASQNIININLIRSWVMPYYGQGTAQSSLSSMLGAPPDILIFDVYGDTNISNLPVVLTSYHWVYPDSVDYIPSTDGTPFPMIMEVTLSLTEAYSPEEYTGFDITKYKSGDMVGAFTFSSTPTQ